MLKKIMELIFALAVLAGLLVAVLLYWGMLVLAIYAWQWSDPVTW